MMRSLKKQCPVLGVPKVCQARLVPPRPRRPRGSRSSMGRSGPSPIPALALVAFSLLACRPDALSGQAALGADSLRHIQSVSPMSGPPGTLVDIYTENLPVQARVHVGVGAIGTGFEALTEAHQEMWGEVSASVRVPNYTTWEKPVVFIIFNGIFSPIGISDPFHVTNSEGLVRRRGVITGSDSGCVTLQDSDSFAYALTGAVDNLNAGDEVVVEGNVTESGLCQVGSALNVVRVSRP